jgi:predicted MFS family arabinose efflux permease
MRRNLLLLAASQALGQAANTMMFLATALAVSTFIGAREFATLPITMQHLGVMCSVFPAALLMQRRGRSFGFRLGSVLGMAGAALGGTGLVMASLPLMCVGGLVLGFAVANVQMYRFAAVELVPGALRARAISWVTAGGIAAGMIGPGLVRLTFDRLTPIYLATYATMFVVHMVVFAILSLIRFPPPSAPSAVEGPRRPLLEIAAQPKFAVAVAGATVASGTMTFLMSASPIAIVGCGLPQTAAHLVVFMHVMGMFVPSLFTGGLISRYGVLNVMTAGGAILALSVVPAMTGLGAWHFRIALTLVGIGWNFLFVGATALVTTTYRPGERGKAQALNDFLVFGTTAASSFLAAYLLDQHGWFTLNEFSLVFIGIGLAAVTWLRLSERQTPAEA